MLFVKGGFKMAKMIHSMIRVLEEKRSVEFYKSAFSLEIADRLEFEEFVLVYLSNSETDFELELTINKSQTQPYNLGDGYGHIAVSVEDVEAEHERFSRVGLNPRKLVDFKNNGENVAKFFFVADPDGYQIEVLQRAGRFK
jgi:lactoylglutathione lyase